MTSKKVLVKSVSERLDYLSEEDTEFAVDTVIDCFKQNLIKGNRIEIRGFGSFSIRQRKYAGRDEYYNTIYYRMSKTIFERLNPELVKPALVNPELVKR